MRDVGLQKYTKKSVLNVGFICVTGPQGVGKTSFVTALLRSDYKKSNKQRYKTSLEFVRSLRSTGYYPSLKMPQHLYFSNTDIALRGSLSRPKAKCWFIDTQRLALPNDLFEVQYFPQGSVVFISEADLQLSNRDWHGLNNYMISLIKFVRHNQMTIIFDMQQDGMLDKALRGLETERFEILEKGEMSKFLKRIRWRYDWCRPQLLLSRENKVKSGIKFSVFKQREAFHRGSFRYFGNIFKCYNSFTGINYFINGLQNYETINHPICDLTPESVSKYCKMFPLVRQAKNDKSLLNAKIKKEVKNLIAD